MSLPVRGAWIEIHVIVTPNAFFTSLPVRGAWIEMTNIASICAMCLSLPVRGAWIEIIVIPLSIFALFARRSPCGERGLKSILRNRVLYGYSRSPCGERGLK